MPDFFRVLALTGLALLALDNCSSTPTKKSGSAKHKPRATAPIVDASGQIPPECQALLNKSSDWGFQVEKTWKPATPEAALAAADFFATFHLVPENTSEFVRVWLNEDYPRTPAQAQQSLDRMNRYQSCDVLLAHKLILGLLLYPWQKSERPAFDKDLLRFVLNQQARTCPAMARAVQLDVVNRAVRKGFIHADESAVQKIRKWFFEKMASGQTHADEDTDPVRQWKQIREEINVSEEVRERLGRILPLP